MNSVMPVRLCGVFLLIVGCRLFGQQQTDNPTKGESTIRLNVRQVLVPVIVTDKKGNPITTLRASDFHVSEDGVPQKIVAFTKETATSAANAVVERVPIPPASTVNVPEAVKDSPVAPATPGRIWVICFDALHTSFASFTRARTAVEKLFDQERETGDRFVLLSLGRQLRVIQPATSDVSAIRAKLDSKEFTSIIGGFETVQLVNAVNDVRRRMDIYCTACPCGRDAKNIKNTCDVERQQIKQDLDARSDQFTMFDKAFFAGLKSVVEELAKIDGHHTLVLVSDGFTLMPGKELYATASAYLPNSPYFKFDPVRNMQPALDESLKVAAARDIVVSAIDTRGIYSSSFRPGGLSDASNAAPGATGRQDVLARGNGPLRGGTLLEETDSKWSSVQQDNGSVLAQLAEATGGIYFHDNNDLLKGFGEVLGDKSQSYMLAYVPSNPAADGKFRHITVSVNAVGVKPENTIVRNKSGYWAEGVQDQR
jgi:VWFA-related protein